MENASDCVGIRPVAVEIDKMSVEIQTVAVETETVAVVTETGCNDTERSRMNRDSSWWKQRWLLRTLREETKPGGGCNSGGDVS